MQGFLFGLLALVVITAAAAVVLDTVDMSAREVYTGSNVRL
jgi:hypothetical protein